MDALVRIDMHCHTEFSKDCVMTFQEVIATAQKRKLDFLAITDHNQLEGALRLREIAPAQIIPGEEIKTSAGEIMGLFLEEPIPPGLSPEETVARIKGQGGVVYVPHPFDRLRRSPLKTEKLLDILPDVDILEVYNSRCLFQSDNCKAERFAEKHFLLRGGGSDAHIPYEIGLTFVELPAFEGKEGFLESLKRGRVVGRLSSPLVHFASTWNKFRKRRRAVSFQ